MQIVITTVNNNMDDNNKLLDKIEKLIEKNNISYCTITLED